MKKGLLIALGVVLILAVLLMGAYNGLVSTQENVQTKLGDLDAVLQRRADLIPNLVKTVKAATEHEKEVIKELTDARAKLAGAKNVEEMNKADNELSGAINGFLALAESNPELKANENFIRFQDELAGGENRIAVARKDYNDSVKAYNLKIKRFPTNLIAGMFGFEQAKYFEASQGSEVVPDVNFE